MPQRLTVLLIDNDSAAKAEIAALLKRCRRPVHLCATVNDLPEGMKSLQSDLPQIIILQVTALAAGIKDIALIHAQNPQAMVMVTTSEMHQDWILALIRAGAGEYLTKPLNLSEFNEAIERAAKLFEDKEVAGVAKGRVITVYNPSGGMGTTTIAVNLAASLAGTGKMTALIDLNPFSSDVTALLDLNPAYTLSSISATQGRIDAGFLMSIMARHASGIHILSGPEEIGVTAEIAPDQIRNILPLMQGLFVVTIIDAGGALSERNLAIFDSSDLLLYPVVLTLPALNNAKRYLTALDYRGFGPDRVKVVVNRYHPKDDIKIADAEKILSAKLSLTIPNSYVEIKESIYKGTPLVTGYPRSPVTKALHELARHVMA